MTNPELLTYPFAKDGDRNSIPAKQATALNGFFSEKTGFPSETSIPVISGGKNVQRKDMNGAFYFLSNILFYLQKGKIFVWDAGQVYYTPSIVSYTVDEVQTFYVCIKDVPSVGPIVPSGEESPVTEGWYEKKTTNTYFVTSDTSVDWNKTYYVDGEEGKEVVTPTGSENPHAKGWYEMEAVVSYVLTADTLILTNKVYYKYLGTAPNLDTTHWMSIYDYLYIPPEAGLNNLLADREWVREHTQDKTAHFRGHFKNWAAVPTDKTKYLADYMGETTPTVNDYIVVEDCADFPSSLLTDDIKTVLANTEHIAPDAYTNLNGRWYFTLKTDWSETTTKQGWIPRYQVDEKLSDTLKAAINSGINATLTAQITTNKNNIGTHNASQQYNYISSSKSDRENLDLLDAKAGASVGGNYIKASDTFFANLSTLDTKIGALTANGNYVLKDNTVLANVSAVDTALGKLSADGNYILTDKNVYENITALDTQTKNNTDAIALLNSDDTTSGSVAYAVKQEETRATNVETNLGSRITTIDSKIDSNVSATNQMQGKTYIDNADTAIDDKISTAATSANRATDKKYVDDADTALSERITTNATNISTLDTLKAPLESPALTGTPTAPTAAKNTSTTQIATTAFVVTEIEDKIETADALLYKGTIEGGNTGAYGALTPTAHRGWLYKVSVAGKIDGVAVEVGDVLICNTDKTAEATASNYTTIVKNWDFIQTNIDGAVIGPESALDTHIATFNGASGKLIQDSGFTIKTSVPENAVFTDHITTAEDSGTGNGVASVTADANGKLTVAKTTFLVAADIESKADKTYVDDEVGKINAKIPAEATSLNQLADKQFVDTELLEKVGFTDYASNTKAGAVKIDDNTLKITENGVLYVWSAGDVAVELDNSKTYISALKYTDKSSEPTKTYYVDTRAVRSADDQSQTLYNELTDIETNKPDRSELKTVAFTGSYTDLTNKYELPKATAETLGGVKQGTGVTIDSDGVLSCYSDSSFYNNGTSGNIDPSNGRTQLTSATTIVMGAPLQNMSTTVMLWCSSGAVTFDTTAGANVIFPQGTVLPTATSGVVIYQLMGIGAEFWCAICLGVFDADVEYWNYDPTTKTLTFVEVGNTFSYDEENKTLATTSNRFSYDSNTETIVHT